MVRAVVALVTGSLWGVPGPPSSADPVEPGEGAPSPDAGAEGMPGEEAALGGT